MATRTKEGQSQIGQTGLEPQNFSQSASNITQFLSSRIPNYEDTRPFIDKKKIMRNFKKDYFEERKEISSIRSDIVTKQRRDWSTVTLNLSVATGADADDDDDDEKTEDDRLEKIFERKDNSQLYTYSKTFGDENRLDNIEKIQRMNEVAAYSLKSLITEYSEEWQKQHEQIMLYKKETDEVAMQIFISSVSFVGGVMLAYVTIVPSGAFISFVTPQLQGVFKGIGNLMEGLNENMANTILASINDTKNFEKLVLNIFQNNALSNVFRFYGIIKDTLNIARNKGFKLAAQNMLLEGGSFVINDVVGIIFMNGFDFYALGIKQIFEDKFTEVDGAGLANLFKDLFKNKDGSIDFELMAKYNLAEKQDDVFTPIWLINGEDPQDRDSFIKAFMFYAYPEGANLSTDQLSSQSDLITSLLKSKLNLDGIISAENRNYLGNPNNLNSPEELLKYLYSGIALDEQWGSIEGYLQSFLNNDTIPGLGNFFYMISSNITSGLMYQGKQMMSVSIDKMIGAHMTPLQLQNYKNEEKRSADKYNKQMAIMNKWYKRLRKVDGDENISDYFEEKWKYIEDTVTNFLHDNKTESTVLVVISAAYINGILIQEYFEPLLSLVEGKNLFATPQHWIFTPFTLILQQLDVGRILRMKQMELRQKMTSYAAELLNEAYDIRKLLKDNLFKITGFSKTKYDRMNNKLKNVSKVKDLMDMAFIREYVWHNMFISLMSLMIDVGISEAQRKVVNQAIFYSGDFLVSVNQQIGGILHPYKLIQAPFKRLFSDDILEPPSRSKYFDPIEASIKTTLTDKENIEDSQEGLRQVLAELSGIEVPGKDYNYSKYKHISLSERMHIASELNKKLNSGKGNLNLDNKTIESNIRKRFTLKETQQEIEALRYAICTHKALGTNVGLCKSDFTEFDLTDLFEDRLSDFDFNKKMSDLISERNGLIIQYGFTHREYRKQEKARLYQLHKDATEEQKIKQQEIWKEKGITGENYYENLEEAINRMANNYTFEDDEIILGNGKEAKIKNGEGATKAILSAKDVFNNDMSKKVKNFKGNSEDWKTMSFEHFNTLTGLDEDHFNKMKDLFKVNPLLDELNSSDLKLIVDVESKMEEAMFEKLKTNIYDKNKQLTDEQLNKRAKEYMKIIQNNNEPLFHRLKSANDAVLKIASDVELEQERYKQIISAQTQKVALRVGVKATKAAMNFYGNGVHEAINVAAEATEQTGQATKLVGEQLKSVTESVEEAFKFGEQYRESVMEILEDISEFIDDTSQFGDSVIKIRNLLKSNSGREQFEKARKYADELIKFGDSLIKTSEIMKLNPDAFLDNYAVTRFDSLIDAQTAIKEEEIRRKKESIKRHGMPDELEDIVNFEHELRNAVILMAGDAGNETVNSVTDLFKWERDKLKNDSDFELKENIKGTQEASSIIDITDILWRHGKEGTTIVMNDGTTVDKAVSLLHEAFGLKEEIMGLIKEKITNGEDNKRIAVYEKLLIGEKNQEALNFAMKSKLTQNRVLEEENILGNNEIYIPRFMLMYEDKAIQEQMIDYLRLKKEAGKKNDLDSFTDIPVEPINEFGNEGEVVSIIVNRINQLIDILIKEKDENKIDFIKKELQFYTYRLFTHSDYIHTERVTEAEAIIDVYLNNKLVDKNNVKEDEVRFYKLKELQIENYKKAVDIFSTKWWNSEIESGKTRYQYASEGKATPNEKKLLVEKFHTELARNFGYLQSMEDDVLKSPDNTPNNNPFETLDNLFDFNETDGKVELKDLTVEKYDEYVSKYKEKYRSKEQDRLKKLHDLYFSDEIMNYDKKTKEMAETFKKMLDKKKEEEITATKEFNDLCDSDKINCDKFKNDNSEFERLYSELLDSEKNMIFDKTELMSILEEMRSVCESFDGSKFECFKHVLKTGKQAYSKDLYLMNDQEFNLEDILDYNEELISAVIKSYDNLVENNTKFFNNFQQIQNAKSRVDTMNKRIQELFEYRNGICKMRSLLPGLSKLWDSHFSQDISSLEKLNLYCEGRMFDSQFRGEKIDNKEVAADLLTKYFENEESESDRNNKLLQRRRKFLHIKNNIKIMRDLFLQDFYYDSNIYYKHFRTTEIQTRLNKSIDTGIYDLIMKANNKDEFIEGLKEFLNRIDKTYNVNPDSRKFDDEIYENVEESISSLIDFLAVEFGGYKYVLEEDYYDKGAGGGYIQGDESYFYARKYDDAGYLGERSAERVYYEDQDVNAGYGKVGYDVNNDVYKLDVEDFITAYLEGNLLSKSQTGGTKDDNIEYISENIRDSVNENEKRKLFDFLNKRNLIVILNSIEIDEMENYDKFIYRKASEIINNKYSDEYVTNYIKNISLLQTMLTEDSKLLFNI